MITEINNEYIFIAKIDYFNEQSGLTAFAQTRFEPQVLTMNIAAAFIYGLIILKIQHNLS